MMLATIVALIFAGIGVSGAGAFILFWTAAFIAGGIVASIILVVIGVHALVRVAFSSVRRVIPL